MNRGGGGSMLNKEKFRFRAPGRQENREGRILKGVFTKNERGYRLNAIKKRAFER